MIGIYSIINLDTNKCYIGSASVIDRRWRAHKAMLNRNAHHSHRLQTDWVLFGPKKFKFEVVEQLDTQDNLELREQHWINYFDAANPKKGYNEEPDAVRHTHSEETRKKISLSNKALNRKYIPKPETIVRLREAHLGQPAWNEGLKLPRIKRNCLVCGNEFELGCRTDPKIFCSRKCKGISARKLVDLVCPVCKWHFQRKPSEIDTYCSRECYYKSLKGNKHWAGKAS
jgi:group I intron endonuclease